MRTRIAGIVRVALALLIAVTAGPPAPVWAQSPADEAQIKAAFVFNFLKFVEWPASAFRAPGDSLVIAIVGDGATASATARLLAGRQVMAHPLAVHVLNWDSALTGTHAVLVTESNAKRVRHVLDAAAAGSVLSIGEGADFASKSGVIGLFVEEQKVRFDVNLDVAEASGLKVSSKLLALTRVVHSSRTSGSRP